MGHRNCFMNSGVESRLLPGRSSLIVWLTAAVLFGGDLGADAQLSPGFMERGQKHWSFQPVRKVQLPDVTNTPWVKTPIDRFILAALEGQGLSPAAVADKRTLIRRASFDLTGLPPTRDQVERFLADDSPNAFAQLTDRLLASPRYGERWARHWLDVARYADNKGYVFFEDQNYPWAWTYRDYVVRAFNEDKPFNRFVMEQLAADQIDLSGDDRAFAALGFITVGDHFSNNTHDILDDRIDVVTRGLLGLTVACARCHHHKFDPIPTEDYYALYGIFRSSSEPMAPPLVEAPALTEDYEGFELELLARERELRDFVESKHREIVQGARTRVADYLMAVYAQRNQPPTENFMLIADQGDLNPTVISRWRIYLERTPATNAIWAPWIEFAELSESHFTELATNAHRSVLKTVRLNSRVAVVFSGEPPKSMKDVAELYGRALDSVEKKWQEALAKAVKSGEPVPARLPDEAQEELRHVLYGSDAPPDVPVQMDWGFLSLLPDRASQGEYKKLLKAHEEWIMHGPQAPARAMVLRDLPVAYEPRVFLRGNPNRPGEKVPRRFLQLLDPSCRPFTRGSGRLELAEAICDPNNPLTARVFVNRVWLHHFGAGFVKTPSDFGVRSDPPSHPELLDWLAGEFMRSGWRVKDLHRLIMNSAVYQQSSVAPSATRDPENRLLSRMNRRRHEFETQRDALLVVAGRLDDKPGGAPVGLESLRRTLYTFINRMDVPPVMTTFDFPSPSTSCPQRGQTTVAPQALYLMNNDFAAGSAAALLRRHEVAEATEAAAKVNMLHSILFARPATEVDLRRAREFLGSDPREKAWQHYAHALLMANEFVFVD